MGITRRSNCLWSLRTPAHGKRDSGGGGDSASAGSPETWRHRLYSSQARIAVGHEPEYRPVLHGRRGAAMDQRVCWTCDRLTAEPEELGAVARADGWRMWNGHGISYRQQSELRDIPAVPVLR